MTQKSRVSHGIAHNMYAFCQPRRGLLWTLAVLQIFGLLGRRGNNRVTEAQPTVDMKGEAEIFSSQWVREYSGDNPGCELGRVSYTWRFSGFGSNINSEYNLLKRLDVTIDTSKCIMLDNFRL